jgi:hypothetical protein
LRIQSVYGTAFEETCLEALAQLLAKLIIGGIYSDMVNVVDGYMDPADAACKAGQFDVVVVADANFLLAQNFPIADEVDFDFARAVMDGSRIIAGHEARNRPCRTNFCRL